MENKPFLSFCRADGTADVEFVFFHHCISIRHLLVLLNVEDFASLFVDIKIVRIARMLGFVFYDGEIVHLADLVKIFVAPVVWKADHGHSLLASAVTVREGKIQFLLIR